jgi:hypothetical protein
MQLWYTDHRNMSEKYSSFETKKSEQSSSSSLENFRGGRAHNLAMTLLATTAFIGTDTVAHPTSTEKSLSPQEKTEYLIHLFGKEYINFGDYLMLNNKKLSPSQHIATLYKVSDRISALDRYKSFHVENISIKDPHAQLYARCIAYFQEISKIYLNQPETLHIKDFEIVNSLI